MSTTDKLKLIGAEVAARVVIYGAIGVPAVIFLGWITVPALALSASEPWLNMGIAKAGAWLESPNRPQWVQDVLSRLNPIIDHFTGSPWWKHVARFLPGVVIGAFMPVPAVLSHSVLGTAINHLLGSGTVDTIWQGAVGGIMFTTLPAMTNLMTTGITKGFDGLAAAARRLPVFGERLSQFLKELSDLHVEGVVRKLEKTIEAKDIRVAQRAGLRAVAVQGRAVRPVALMEAGETPAPGRSTLRTVERVKSLAGQFRPHPRAQMKPMERGLAL